MLSYARSNGRPVTEGGAAGHSSGAVRRRAAEVMSSGGVFAAGLVISRLAAIALLPVYTRFLTPADYGVMTILDLVQEVLRLALGTAFLASAGRLHFDSDSEDRRARVWWLALLSVLCLTVCVTTPLVALSPMMARLSFGPAFEGGTGLRA